MTNLEKSASNKTPGDGNPHHVLAAKVESWRDRLLDLGNRNALINTRFSERSSTIEIDTPSTEGIWRKLAAETEAGADAMRFPWRRDLVPPPSDWQEYEDFTEDGNDGDSATPPPASPSRNNDSATVDAADRQPGNSPTISKRKRREWNPPLEECRRSPHLGANDLLVDKTDKVLDRKLRNLDSHARLAMSEQGVHVLYVVFGFLKWFESVDSTEERYSPLMLVPVTLSRDSTSAPWEMTEAEDDAVDNLCLRLRLLQDFKLELPPLPDINELEEDGARETYLDEVHKAIEKHDRWEVVDKCVIGRFAFPKIAMWRDLGDHKNSVMDHALCRALGGDESVIGVKSFGPVTEVPSSRELDDAVPPGELKTILDCDSSQLEAIVAARKGVSFVLDGPPGTGKSQTIANIVADALSLGRTVLFVSEKISALEVVKQRLESRQLDDFCLECHSDKANRRAVLFELERCLDLPAEVYQDTAPKLEELQEQRSRLNDYVRRIHEPREPLGLSAFELFGRVSRLTSRGLAQLTRCKLPSLLDADRATFDGWMRLLGRAGDTEGVIIQHGEHPWRGCKQTTRSLSIHDNVHHHFGILNEQLRRISLLFAPIVERNLLSPITASNLNDSLNVCKIALMVPNIPVAWLDAPGETATAIVALLTAEAKRASILSELGCFVDEVEETFPVETAQLLTTEVDNQATTVIQGLIKQPSINVRERLAETGREIERLSRVSESLRELKDSLREQVHATGLGAEKDFGIGQISQLATATRLAATAGPARPHWLNPKHAKPIRTLSEKALTFLNKNEALAQQLSDVIASEQLEALGKVLQHDSRMADSLSYAAEHGLSDRASLVDAYSHIVKAVQLVEEVAATSCEVAKALGVRAPDGALTRPTVLPEQLLESLRDVEEAGFFCGSWRDASVRDPICQACDDAIEDLDDAESVRESLSDRLSHRAFRESASSMATRGAAYSSTIKRWFGGFGTFRNEVAELYRGDVPKGAVVANDMATLQKYHRRIRDVRDEAVELKPYLPEQFLAEESSAWARLKSAVIAMDHLATVWPEAVALIPDGNHVVSSGSLTTLAKRLITAANEYESLISDFNLDLPRLGNEDVDSIKAALDDHRALLATCGEIWDQCEELTLRPLTSVAELEQLIKAANKHDKRHTDLREAAEKYGAWMPEESAPTTVATWQAMRDGIDAAELFEAVSVDAEELQAVWCNESFRLSEESWSIVGRQLEDSVTAVQAALETAGLDTGGTPLSGVIDAIRLTIETLKKEQECLGEVTKTLRVNQDIAIDKLVILADRIVELRTTRPTIMQAKAELDSLGIADVDPEDLQAASWLAQTVTDGKLDPLTKAVAAEEGTRQQVCDALTKSLSIVKDVDFKDGWDFLKTLFDVNTEVSNGYVIAETPLGELGEWLGWLVTQMPHFDDWLKFSSWKRDVTEAGFGTVVDELITRQYAPQDTSDVVAVQFYRQLFDRLAETDRTLGNFDVNEHERIRERFRFLDQWEIKAAASRIRQYQLGRDDRPSNGFLGAESSELGILQKEIAKKRKHKPLRRLFAEIPTVLQRLKPCIMMSPLSVSTFLDTDDIRFDLVIFDEASQVFPWDSLGAIYRGKQLIVAGDDKQLPPTNFFNRADTESDDDEEDIGDYESILSLCKSIGMPNQRLKWHYRSRREPLIAFSNRHFYDGELVTFPSVYDASGDGVRFEHVQDGRWVDRKNLKEAERIVGMIVEHVQNKPTKSLGIIALNQSQQRAIEDSLYDLRRERPEVDALFDGANYFGTVNEGLFIKNLENVQGDERDVIFLSMGYGFNDVGKFNKNFGPINRQNGERRLNVAVTRAREELVFVSSVRAADMDLTSSKSEGAHLLKAYLNYAEKGVDTLGLAIDERASEVESPFEEEVAAALIRRGLDPVPQVGCGGFRIDLALKHPERSGEFCLAVECDGATYHSSHTARDRDRIRQTILENLGWRIVRIWSTDWIRDPDRQIDRVLHAYEASVEMSPPEYWPSAEVVMGDEEELEPQYVEKTSATKPVNLKFSSIEEVPGPVIQSTAVYVLTQAGAMNLNDLVKQTSRELGFRRLGGKIKSRIENQLGEDLENGRLKRLGERVTTELRATEPAWSEIDCPVEQLVRECPPILTAPFNSDSAVAAQQAWASHLGMEVEVTNTLGMPFRVIPPGTFEMGSMERDNERPIHKVTITQPKLFGVYPVTQAEWTQVMGRNPSCFQNDASRFPVEQVSWEDCQRFLEKLNEDHSLEGWCYRLPTEAEWEYTCRAGATTRWWFGDKVWDLDETDSYPYDPYAVGQKRPNPFGVHDMHGSVSEWCVDWYKDDYYGSSPATDPKGPLFGVCRVLRGGWYEEEDCVAHASVRDLLTPKLRRNFIGIRVVASECLPSGTRS